MSSHSAYNLNFKMKSASISFAKPLKQLTLKKKQEERMNATLDDQIYLLSLVYTNNIDKLKCLFETGCVEFNLNFIYKIPIKNTDDLIEEVKELMIVDSVNNRKQFEKLEFFKRLLRHYNIKSLDVNSIVIETSTPGYYSFSYSSVSSASCDSAYEFDMKRVECTDNEIDDIECKASETNSYFNFTLLHIACMIEDISLVKLLLRNGASIKPFQQFQINPIHLALYESDNVLLRLLLDQLNGEDTQVDRIINKLFDDKGYNPLNIAIYHGNEEALSLLYNVGADMNFCSDTITYPLIWALENVEIPYNIVLKLLELGTDVNIIDKTEEFTPLIVAVLANRIDLVELLIRFGANVNMLINNDTCRCALQLAIDRVAETNDCKLIKILLDAGANPSFYSNEKIIPSQLMTREAAKSLSQHGGALLDAIRLDNIKVAEMLLDYNAYPHTITSGNYSPICSACFLGNSEMVKLLLKHGVDPTLNCHNSNTPLTIAISANHDDIVRLLLPYYNTRESINRQDLNGDHALLYAAVNKNHKIIRELLRMGAHADLLNKYNVNAVWYCVYNNDKKSLMELLPFIKDFDKKSCGIEYNEFQGPPEIIYETLLSPIDLCIQTNKYSILYSLLIAGAKIPQSIKRQMANENRNGFLNEIKIINECLNKPQSLKRQCRCFLKFNDLLDSSIKTPIPNELKNFIQFKVL